MKEFKRKWKCQLCPKEYLSYPALYTHAKTKHEGKSLFLKRGDRDQDQQPVKKVKTILNEDNVTSKEVEIEFVVSLKEICLKLFKMLQKDLLLKVRPKKHVLNQNKLKEIIESGLVLANQLDFPNEVITSHSQIFTKYQTQVC